VPSNQAAQPPPGLVGPAYRALSTEVSAAPGKGEPGISIAGVGDSNVDPSRLSELKGTAVLDEQAEPGAINYGGGQKQAVPRDQSDLHIESNIRKPE